MTAAAIKRPRGPRADAAYWFEELRRVDPLGLFANQSSTVPFPTRRSPANLLDPAGRNLNAECGYPTDNQLTREYYKELYDRGGIAHRVVNIWPDECWAAYPELYETEGSDVTPFEAAWNDLSKRTNPWHYLHRIDKLSGIGHYGVLLYGFSGNPSLHQPPVPMNRDGTVRSNASRVDLLYLRAFDESLVTITEVESDAANPRYGQPTEYQINFADPTAPVPYNVASQVKSLKVHWTRVLHVAEHREASEIFATPRCGPVVNNLHDIRKVAGSSAEMFWKGGFPGYQFETDPALAGMVDVEELAARVKDEAEAYMQGLQRYLTAAGGRWASLAPQVADPSKHLSQQLQLLAATIGVPLSVLLGTQMGQIAGTDMTSTWKERVGGRQKNYLEPLVVNPFVDRLILFGALPKPGSGGYKLQWRDLKTLGEKDQADVALKKTQAFMQYVTGQVWRVIPPRLFLTLVVGLTGDEAEAVVGEAGGENKVVAMLESMIPAAPKTQGGGRVGAPPTSANDTGRPAGVVEGQA